MKHAVISFSELGNRWDAGFHLTRKKYETEAFRLSQKLSKEEAFEIVSNEKAFSTETLKVLEPLVRGQFKGREYFLKAAKEYPFLALALVMENAKNIIEQQMEELEYRKENLDLVSSRLQQLMETPDIEKKPVTVREDLPGVQAIPETQLSLLENNKFVAGCVYVSEDNELVIPVHTDDKAYVVDCWVIPVSEWRGVQTLDHLIAEGNVPVPVRNGDIGIPVGYVELPGHEQNYGMGWR